MQNSNYISNYAIKEMYYHATKWKSRADCIMCNRSGNEVRIVLKYWLFTGDLYTYSCISLMPNEWCQRLERDQKAVEAWGKFKAFRPIKNRLVNKIIDLYSKAYNALALFR